jgi:hypothetical protein
MPKNRKPVEDRNPEDHWEAAEESLELAKALTGQGGISDPERSERGQAVRNGKCP